MQTNDIHHMENIIQNASKSGWEAMAVAFVLCSALAFLVWLVRTWLMEAARREDRMAKRIDALEDFQRNTLTETIKANSLAVQELTQMLKRRPCLLPEDK